MKKQSLFALLMVFSLIITGCSMGMTSNSVDADNSSSGEIQLSLFAGNSESRAQNTDISESRTVIVTIHKADGTPVYNKKTINLNYIGGGFITQSLSLAPGKYTLEEFFVADKDGTIIFASPKTGSEKAYLVKKPLPIAFTVTKDKVTNVPVEVISAKDCEAEDFGYVSFKFTLIKNFCFLINVQLYDQKTGTLITTEANVKVLNGKTVLYNKDIEAVTEKVIVNDGYSKYQVTVTKAGYKIDTKELTGDELKTYFTTPMIVFLEPEFAVKEAQKITTQGARQWEFFTIDRTPYLAIANYYNNSTRNINSTIYKWNGTSFTAFQNIATAGALDWEYFNIGESHYLAVANHHNDKAYNINSVIYKWNGKAFQAFQNIATQGAVEWEYFTIGGAHYLAVANHHNGTTQNINSVIYKWDGTAFKAFQNIATNGAHDLKYFVIDGSHYLATANYYNDTTRNINSIIYKWDGKQFASYQILPTNGAVDWEFFSIENNHYLAVANHHNDKTYNNNSKIYKWDGTKFQSLQDIATNGAYQWKYFTINDSHYLAVANYYNDTTRNIPSKVYKWNGSSFVETESITTSGALDWEYFTAGDKNYLAVANYHDDKTHVNNSIIYEIVNF